MKAKALLIVCAVVLGLYLIAGMSASTDSASSQLSQAGALATSTPVIKLNKEQGGDIDKGARAQWDGVYENANGALVWNGTEWVINTTWAHTYFTASATGQRLITHTLIASFDGSGAPNVTIIRAYTQTQATYSHTITQSIYTYTVPAKTGGSYTYQAIEYGIAQPDTKRLIVRSRGCGQGSARTYLDTYIEDPGGVHVAALRGDPVMYVYSTTLEQSVGITDELQGAFASLPTSAPGERARYWLDVNQGSDMGGYSYVLRTQALDCLTRNLGSSFPGEFQIQWYEPADNTVHDIRFLPKLLRETYRGQLDLPLVVR